MVISIKNIAKDGRDTIRGGWVQKKDKIGQTFWKAVRRWYALNYKGDNVGNELYFIMQ